MPADLQTMSQEVQYMLGNRTDLAALCDRFVNRAYQTVTQLLEPIPKEAFQTTTQLLVVGTNNYALPSDYFAIVSIRDNTENRRLVQVSQTQFDALNTATQSVPEKYAIWSSTLYLYPTPNVANTLQLRYRKIFGALATQNQQHELSAFWDQPIIILAAVYGSDYLNELERSQHYRMMFRREIASHRDALSAELLDRNEAMQIPGMEVR